MAVTQYIGSRYVPMFADPIEWSSQNTYEPLTIVIHEGNSYTSKQAVPKDIDISNVDFWALTGNYNAQIELYRRETATAQQTANTAQQRADSAQDSADAAQDSADAAQSDINTLLPKSAFLETTVKSYVDDAVNAPMESTYVNYYGADPTGTQDSSAAIAACIAANIGGCIRFKSGTYLISEPIVTKYVESNNYAQRTSIDFQGATIIPTEDMTYAILLNGDVTGNRATRMQGAYIRNGFIYNRDLHDVGIGILCQHALCNNMMIDNMSMKHIAPKAIKFNSNDGTAISTDVLVTNCMIMRSQPSDADSSMAFDFTGARDNKVMNCRAYGYQYGFWYGSGLVAINNHFLVKPGNNTFWENSAYIYSNVGNVYMCYADGYKMFANAGGNRNFNLRIERCTMWTPAEEEYDYYMLAGQHINSINAPIQIGMGGASGKGGFFFSTIGDLTASMSMRINTNELDCRCTLPPIDSYDLAYSPADYMTKWTLEQSLAANKYYRIGRLYVTNVNHEPFSFRIVNVEQKMLHDVLGEVTAISGTLLYRVSGSRLYVTGTKTSNVNYVLVPIVVNNISYVDIYLQTDGSLSNFSLPEIVPMSGCLNVPLHINDNAYSGTYIPESFDTIDLTNAVTLFTA